MLNADPRSRPFEEGRLIGQEEERSRLRQVFHDALSPELLVALFTAHSAEEDLKGRLVPEAAELAKVTSLLDKVIEKITTALNTDETPLAERPTS